MRTILNNRIRYVTALLTALVVMLTPAYAYAQTYHCGSGDGSVTTAINIGCEAKGNPIMDLLFAVIRFLSNGVGLVLVASLIYGGIQYSMARGDPQALSIAQKRIQSVFGALLLFIFAYAMLNYIIPGQVLK